MWIKAGAIALEAASRGMMPAAYLAKPAINFARDLGMASVGAFGQSEQYLYGVLNLLTWPISILWGVPEGVVDANRINERELVYFYNFDESGRQSLADKGLKFNDRGKLEKVK